MLAPHAAATPGLATITAPFSAATPVAERTGTTKRTTRLPGRRVTFRRRPAAGGRVGARMDGITAAVLRRQMINAINAGTHGLEAANVLLASLGQKPLEGNRQVTFRVDVGVRAPYDGLATMIRHAHAVVVDELRELRWTALDGSPEGYGIDEPTAGGRYGTLYGTVHTTLHLAVTVPAYHEHELEATASDLLHRDLARLRRVEPALIRVTLSDRETPGWDEYFGQDDMDDAGWPTVLG